MKKHKILLTLIISLLFFTAYPATVRAEEDGNEDALLAPYFLIQSEDASLECFPLKATDVTANINGIIAETYVVQTYANEGNVPINARYVFPTSSSVTVHGMKMEIGDNVVIAQIKEKEEAKEEYEEAKSEGKSASLLEQHRPNVFSMDVANIMPGDTVRIELHYTELITPAEGIYEFIFPTVVGPRYIADDTPGENAADNTGERESVTQSMSLKNAKPASEAASAESGEAKEPSAGLRDEDAWAVIPYLPGGVTPPGEYHITVNLSTGVPIADVSCKSHEIHVDKKEDSRAEITLADPEDYAGNRDFILKYTLAGEEVQSGLLLTDSGDEKFFLLTVQPPERYVPEDIPPREYIFVLDVSGSMNGFPLTTAKELIRDMVRNLKETDKFNLILFANDTILLSPESLTATGSNIKAALNLIDKEKGGGGTSMMPALETACNIPMEEDIARSVVIITDGYISNEEDIFDLINENMDTASFFSFGIGSSVNDYLIRGIAQCGIGEAFIVTDSEDAADSAERFRTYIEAPLLTGVTVDYGDFDVYDVASVTPSILYAGKPIVLFGKWRGEPSGTVTISGKTGKEDYLQEITADDVEPDTENEAVRYLWARTELDRIAGFGSIRNDSSVKEEITQLGLKYNMTTPYTSFVAVIETVRNEEADSKDVEQASPLPLGVSNLAVGGGYTAYSEPGEGLILLLLAAIPLSVLLRRRKSPKKAVPEP